MTVDSPTQERVRDALHHAGGYWRPLAACARLLEELGELADAETSGEPLEFPGEFADLWIITAAMADQFLAQVPEPSAHHTTGTGASIADLLVAAGPIARIVNYYDGPKTPRTLDGWVTIGPAVSAFHAALANLARARGVDLADAIADKLASMSRSDVGRFKPTFDASTAPSLGAFAEVRAKTQCPFAPAARMWGADLWESSSFGASILAVAQPLASFAKAAVPEQLDAFVFKGAEAPDMAALARWFRRTLTELSRRDPAGSNVMRGRLDRPGWQFEFNRLRMFVAVFSSLYAPIHPRYCAAGTFVFMQPESSFSRRGVGADQAGSKQIKARVRRLFEDAGRGYDGAVKDARIEAPLYLLPRFPGDDDVCWWQPPASVTR